MVFTTDAPVDPGLFKALPGVTRVEPVDERTIVYGRDDRLVVEVDGVDVEPGILGRPDHGHRIGEIDALIDP